MKKRVMVLIDGSNFYHSTAKKGKKVDFEKFLEELSKGMELVGAFYYGASLDINAGEDKYWSHQRFLDKLNKIPGMEVVLCTLKKIKIDGKNAYFVKGDDIRMSNRLIMGAVDDIYGVAVVVSGDEDFADSVRIARENDENEVFLRSAFLMEYCKTLLYGKEVWNAYFSKSSALNLRKACDKTIKLDRVVNNLSELNSGSALSEDHAEH